MRTLFCIGVGGLGVLRRVSSNGYGEALGYACDSVLPSFSISSFQQLVLCAIPVFFKIPGVEAIDLGGRTEGDMFGDETAPIF